MAPDPYILTIAQVRIDGSIALEADLPARVALVAGQELHVNLRYHVKESKLDKEAYRFRLVSRIGDQQPPDREATLYDRPLLRDELNGFIGHRYKFDTPGSHEGTATILAQYLTGKWGTQESTVKDEATQVGTIQVVVH